MQPDKVIFLDHFPHFSYRYRKQETEMSTIKKTINATKQFHSVTRSANEIHTYIDALRLKQYLKFYQESKDPEKTLWAWAAYDFAFTQGRVLPSWVQKHLAGTATNLMELADAIGEKPAMRLKAITKNGKRTTINKKEMLEKILNALQLKGTKGARSGIRQFSKRLRDFEIYLMAEEAKQRGESVSAESVAIKTIAYEFNLSTDRTYKIYRAEQKKY